MPTNNPKFCPIKITGSTHLSVVCREMWHPLVLLQIASRTKQERQEHELQEPEAYQGIVSWASRACAMDLHFWLAPLSRAEQAGPPWSQATSTGRLCARNSPRVCRRCNTTFHWDTICVFPMFFPDFNWPKAFILCNASRVSELHRGCISGNLKYNAKEFFLHYKKSKAEARDFGNLRKDA